MRYFSHKLDSEDGEEHLGETTPNIHLHVGNAQGYPQNYSTS
jgi:hypothetical protein